VAKFFGPRDGNWLAVQWLGMDMNRSRG
jgi:hypothetical protein